MGDQETGSGSWGIREAAAIGGRISRRRRELGLSAQQLASRCAELGVPDLSRQVLMRLEHGRRESVSTAELTVLAIALDIPPVMLLYPIGLAEQTEFAPGRMVSPLDAAQWWNGEATLQDGDIKAAWRGPVMLFREHAAAVAGMPGEVTEAQYTSLRHRQFSEEGLTADERVTMLSVVALGELREHIRRLQLTPPELPGWLAWLDPGPTGR